MEQLKRHFSGMGFNKDNQKQNKHLKNPEQEHIKQYFSETTFETYLDVKLHGTHEPRRRVLNRDDENYIFFCRVKRFDIRIITALIFCDKSYSERS